MTNRGWLLFAVPLAPFSGCDEYQHPSPPPRSPAAPAIPPSQFTIAGRWDGITEQTDNLGAGPASGGRWEASRS
jgi:hypothetical protein